VDEKTIFKRCRYNNVHISKKYLINYPEFKYDIGKTWNELGYGVIKKEDYTNEIINDIK
jgi:hypothetical protein